MKNTKLFLFPAMLIFLIFLVGIASAGSVTVSLFYDSTTADSLTIINGNSAGVIVSADSIFENSMAVKLDVLDSNGNLVVNMLDTYTTLDSYSRYLMVGQAAYSGPGSYTLRATVTGASGQSDTDELSLRVLPQTINHPPVITSTPITQVNEGQAYRYQVTATDADGDILTYSLTENPSWLSINSQTGAITGTAPSVNADTQYNVVVRVSDGTDFAKQSFTVIVKNVPIPPANKPPVITSTPITRVNEGQAYNYQVVAEDPDNSSLIYTLTQAPSWLSISNIGLIMGAAPQVNSDTPYSVTVRVSDGINFVEQSYVLTVIDVTAPDTVPPVITVVSPINGQTYTSSNILFWITTNENIDFAWYRLDGGSNISMNFVSSTDFRRIVSLSDGSHTVKFYARDLAGNIGQSDVINFYIDTSVSDTTPPIVTISSPVNGETYTSHRTQIIFTASDANLDRCWYRLNNGLNVNTACNVPITGITSVQGTNTWIVYAIDLAGNIGSASVTFKVNIPSGSGGGVSGKNIGARYVSDADGTKEYLNQFAPKTVVEEEEVIIAKKELSFWESSWLGALIILLILIVLLIIFWRRR